MTIVEKNGFISSVNHFKTKQNASNVSKAAYLGIPSYLHESWIKNIQNSVSNQPSTTSLFDAENQLIQSLYGSSTNSNAKKVFLFCNLLKASSQGSLSSQNTLIEGAAIDACKEQIAKLVFLAEKDLAKTASLIDPTNLSYSYLKIQSFYDKEIQKIIENIEHHRKQHEKIPLQDSRQVVSIHKPLAIASLLMTSSGILNLGLIDSIKKTFFDLKSDLRIHEKDLIQTLDVIKDSSEIQQTLRNIIKPASPNFVSNDLIRITLGLPVTVMPTNIQSKVVGLAALLSDIRQGDVGNYFATSVSILKMGPLKAKIASDLSSILNQGMLPSKTDRPDFVPVIDSGDGTSQKLHSVKKNGMLDTSKGYLWEAPGIIAASKQLGIENTEVEILLKKIIKERSLLNQTPCGTLDFTVEDLIIELIKKVKGNTLSIQQEVDLKNLALMAFNAETNVPLLAAWESCLAARADSSNGNKVRQRILECIKASIKDQWPKKILRGLTTEARKVQAIFYRMLESGIQLRYDEEVLVNLASNGVEEGLSTVRAFTLHELIQGKKTTSSKKISSPEEFRTFVLNRIKATQEVVNNMTSLTDTQRKAYQQSLDKINTFILKTRIGLQSFLYKTIKSYDKKNEVLNPDLNNWEELDHLPFRIVLI